MTTKNLKFSTISYFFVTFLLDGFQKQSGVFLREMLHSMNLSRQSASLPFFVSWAVGNVVASFSGTFVQNKKSNYIILTGVLLSAVGTALCLLASNITALVISWGLIFGTGYGLSSPHLIKRLKELNASNTSLLLEVAPSIFTILMPFITYALISIYELQGSFLIFSGLILNYLPLSLATVYKIKLRLPHIQWTITKRTSQYYVSTHPDNKTFNESFTNSLEPDLILKISQSDASEDDIKSKRDSFEPNEQFSDKSERSKSEEDSASSQGSTKLTTQNKILSEVLIDIEKIEKENCKNSFSKNSFSRSENCSSHSNQSNKYIVSSCKSSLNTEVSQNKSTPDTPQTNECKVEFTNKHVKYIKNREIFQRNVLPNLKNCTVMNSKLVDESVYQGSLNENDSIDENHPSSHSEVRQVKNRCMPNNDDLQVSNDKNKTTIHENNTLSEKIISNESYKQQNLDIHMDREYNVAAEQRNKTFSSNVIETVSVSTKNATKNSGENFKNSNHSPKKTLKVPVEIKVHIEECSFLTDEEYWLESMDFQNSKPRKNSYRKHSNSMLPGTYDNMDFSRLSFPAKNSKINKTKLYNVFSISENVQIDSRTTTTSLERKNTNNEKDTYAITKLKEILKFLSKITMPVCLSMIFITITFEVNLVTLIAIFADYGNDIDGNFTEFRWILVSYGIGGLLGKLCYFKISKTISENSNSVGMVLFLLKGLSIAGVLFSSSIQWLALFYCVVGILEEGLTHIIPKLMLKYVNKSIHSHLTATRKFLTGVVIVFVPYMIGFSRDQLGDYEFLLQTLSCSCVFCAFIIYFVPHISNTNKNQNI